MSDLRDELILQSIYVVNNFISLLPQLICSFVRPVGTYAMIGIHIMN